MCLLVVVSRVVPDWPLIVAANRDERFERPSLPLGVLRAKSPLTLGGRDLRAGGTWLAVNQHGVVAGLTNQPAPDGPAPGKRSRGEIPLALTAAASAGEAVSAFGRDVEPTDFNSCWVLVGDRRSLYLLDLTKPGPLEPTELAPGVHILENKPLGQPSAKVDRVRDLLGELRGRSGDEVTRLLEAVLQDHRLTTTATAGDEKSERAAQVSACCVHTEDYGTRSSMLVRLPSRDGVDALPEVRASDGPSCRNPMFKGAFAGCER